ncbi:MAG: hypothetical protein AB7F75_02115 [Planctomycetota bacterium]
MRSTRGFVLIITLALLGMLAYLTLLLVQSSWLARKLSHHSIHLTEATLTARSGLEKALQASQAMLNRGTLPPWAENLNLMTAGEDGNLNGILDAGEDLDLNGRISYPRMERDPTPSLVLRDSGSCVRETLSGGQVRGVSWRNEGALSNFLCTLRISIPCLDLNAGVRSGAGPEGQRYQVDQGMPYTSNSLTHPFNIPLRRFLNAWGNYHKYVAMVRPTMTYNFDRSTKFGKVDGTDNLMATATESHNPWSKFDDFNPSGNHATDASGATINSETPLGDMILSARPSSGFHRMDDVLPIVEAYVQSWTDKAGRRAVDGSNPWTYANGLPIPVVGKEKISDIVDEFASLAALEPDREPSWIFMPGTPSSLPANEPAIPNSFEQHDNRHYLYTKIYNVPAMRVDITRAPLSVLAALVHAPGNVQTRSYNKQTSQLEAPQPLIPYQSENNVPCYWSYGGANRHWIVGKPLFSMTESIRMAEDLVVQSEISRFGLSTAGLREFLRSWRRGYDAKFHEVYYPNFQFNTVDWGLTASQFDVVSNYYDLYHGHRRVQVLAELLNPHPNDARVIWDEAMPLAVENRKNRLTKVNNPFQGLFAMMDEANGSLAERGPEAGFHSTKITVTSLGWHKPTGIQRLMNASIRIFRHVSLGTQKEFNAIGHVPSTMAPSLGAWTTYPESLDIEPSDWTGHLALKPSPQVAPWGEQLLMRVPLNNNVPDSTNPKDGIGNAVPAWTIGTRNLLGPSALPARGVLRNSLQPPPGGTPTSLYPKTAAEINTASDLLPGGGIRMSPWNNSPARALGGLTSWPNHKEALLVLRNSLVTDTDDDNLPDPTYTPAGSPTSFVLPSFHEGAISFYVKPKYQPETTNMNGGVSTLFYMPFSVFDEETQQRALTMVPTPTATIAKIRSQYVGSLRLTWSAALLSLDTISRFYTVPASDERWPMIVNFGGFPGQIASGPFYFNNMEGFEDSSINKGWILTPTTSVNGAFFNTGWVSGGDGIEGHWKVPNPFAREDLVLEWQITKFADHPEDGSRFMPGVDSVSPRWFIWEAADALSPLAESTSYQNLLAHARPLYLFDTSDASHPDYHSVHKAFILERPVKTTVGATDRGAGPRDSRGDHQALVESGRWNHIFIAWRNLWQVLGNSAPAKGGCLSVYVNGSFRKTTPDGYAMRSLFMNFYMSSAYRASVVSGQNYLPWDPGFHSIYQSASYSGPSKTPLGTTYTRSFSVPSTGGANLMFFPPMTPAAAFSVRTMHLPYYQYNANLVTSPRKQDVFLRFPPRFYFGFEPHSIKAYNGPPVRKDDHNFFASNITWGSFMDLQIFDKAKQAGPNSPLAADGGFLPDLPQFYDPTASFTPYPSGTSVPDAQLYPLLASTCTDAWRERDALISVSWAAHLPEFHRFWDDQNPAVAGPDDDDIQTLDLDIGYQGTSLGTLRSTQKPGMKNNSSWTSDASPVSISSISDLCLNIKFKGPPVAMSTPLIENIDLVFKKKTVQYDSLILR